MKVLRSTVYVIETINNAIGNVVKYLLLFMAVTMTMDVIARYVFNSPTGEGSRREI